MEADVQTNNREFLEQSLKFYNNINKYASLFEIDSKELQAFNNDMKVFLFIADKRFRSFTEDFILYNITILRSKLDHLFIVCTHNSHYTRKIGEELGIITPQHRISWPLGWAHHDEIVINFFTGTNG